MTKLPDEIYDNFADTYDSNRGAFDISRILDDFYFLFGESKGQILDLGCGAGEPVARYFISHGWQVTGVDFSQRMLELASKYAPDMKAIRADIREVEFVPDQFDAVTATYSLFHLPFAEHPGVFRKIYKWLKPNGRILFTYATKEYTGSEEFSGYKKFIDTDLYYSHKTPEELLSDLEEIGFNLNSTDYHTICDETFLWVTAQKPNI